MLFWASIPGRKRRSRRKIHSASGQMRVKNWIFMGTPFLSLFRFLAAGCGGKMEPGGRVRLPGRTGAGAHPGCEKLADGDWAGTDLPECCSRLGPASADAPGRLHRNRGRPHWGAVRSCKTPGVWAPDISTNMEQVHCSLFFYKCQGLFLRRLSNDKWGAG